MFYPDLTVDLVPSARSTPRVEIRNYCAINLVQAPLAGRLVPLCGHDIARGKPGLSRQDYSALTRLALRVVAMATINPATPDCRT